MAITGLRKNFSASAASRTIERFVPHCTIASQSATFMSLRTVTNSSSETSAIAVALGHFRPRLFTTSKPDSVK